MMGLKQGPVSLMALCPFRSSIVCWILPSLSQTHIAHGSRVSVPLFEPGTVPASNCYLGPQ